MSRKHLRIISMTALLLLPIWSFFIEPGLLTQNNIQKTWSGPELKIAFFSDLHAGAPHINTTYIQNLVERINSMSPDLILIGGDLVINGIVGGEAITIERLAPLLAKLKAPLGVFAVLGNHDWWNDGEKIKRFLEKNGLSVIDNESRLIQINKDFNFWLVGIGDAFTEHAEPEKAISQITSNAPRVLFMHDPAAIFQVREPYLLALAGHMHGGQVYIPGIGALVTPGNAPKSWASGWISHELGSIFVSKGIGTSILPVRFNALPEFVILKLENTSIEKK